MRVERVCERVRVQVCERDLHSGVGKNLAFHGISHKLCTFHGVVCNSSYYPEYPEC